MSCQWVWNKCDYFIKLVFSKCSRCSFLSHFSNCNHKSRTARKSDCYKTHSVNVTFVNREEKSEPKQNKLQTCNRSYRPNSVSDALVCTHTPLHTQTDRERERERERECVCWLRHVFARHVGPTRQMVHSRLEDGQRAIKVLRQPVWGRCDHLRPRAACLPEDWKRSSPGRKSAHSSEYACAVSN